MKPEHLSVVEVVSGSPGETRRIGRQLGRLLRPGDVVLLEGQFGAGKTVLVQGIAAGLGVTDRVSSPSFTLVNEYRSSTAFGSFPVYHADLYRIQGTAEALDLGLDEYLSNRGVFIVEWPERAKGAWPRENLWIHLRIAGDRSRRLEMRATGERYLRMLDRLVAKE